MIGYLSTKLFVHKIPRKKGIMAFTLLSTGMGLCFLFGAVDDSKILQTGIAGITRLFYSIIYVLMMIMVTETFDRKIEPVAIGFVVGGGSSCKFLVPFLIGAMNDIGV